MMHVAFCLCEAGSVFQTFFPDKPNIFMPWTTVLDKSKSGEQEHGNRELGAMAPLQKFNLFLHGTEGGVCSRINKSTGALKHH